MNNTPPLWPIFGYLGATITGNIYLAFKLITLVSGILLIPLSYVAFRKAFGDLPALFSSVLIAFTYVLIDFSGNGSLYILHAFLILVFVFLAGKPERPLNAILLGIVAGLAYLLNYQAIVVLGALIVVYLYQFGFGKQLWEKMPVVILALGCTLVVLMPLLIHNMMIFGSPLYNTNFDYFVSKLGVPPQLVLLDENVIVQRNWDEFSFSSAPNIVFSWILRNLAYISIRILILIPLISIFAFLATIHILRVKRYRQRTAATWAILSLLILHIVISCLWPVYKFRYFVPIIPLIIGLGAYGVFRLIHHSQARTVVITIALIALLTVNVLTYLRVPSHTNYYDSNELFHYRTGESEWQTETRLMNAALDVLDDYPPGAVIGAAAVFYHTHRPLVLATGIKDPDILRFLVEKYEVRYILDIVDRETFYQAAISGDIFYRNESFFTDSHRVNLHKN